MKTTFGLMMALSVLLTASLAAGCGCGGDRPKEPRCCGQCEDGAELHCGGCKNIIFIAGEASPKY